MKLVLVYPWYLTFGQRLERNFRRVNFEKSLTLLIDDACLNAPQVLVTKENGGNLKCLIWKMFLYWSSEDGYKMCPACQLQGSSSS